VILYRSVVQRLFGRLVSNKNALSSLWFRLFTFLLGCSSCGEASNLNVVFLDVTVDVFSLFCELFFQTFDEFPNLEENCIFV
jgi:hypothetical protein